jgi:hypothetical protein
MQVLIGCDGGTNSVVAKYLGLPPVRIIPRPVFRGFTSYPHGHPFENEFLRLRVGDFFIGRLTITDNLVHFFVTKAEPAAYKGPTGGDLRRVRDLVLKDLEDLQYPAEITDLIRRSDPESLNLGDQLLLPAAMGGGAPGIPEGCRDCRRRRHARHGPVQ